MTAQLVALCWGATDPQRLTEFWAGVLGREVVDGSTLLPADESGLRISFLPTHAPKTGPNRMHLDLTSASFEDQQATVARALALGGRHHDVGQLPEEEHVVLADPEGNEFCVIEAGNNFLAGCGVVGAVSSDGTQAVGYFWSEALGWPLVWDRDEETAIQSPHGGSKISWGGPPIAPKTGTNRLHLDLAPSAGVEQQAQVERLVSLGARRTDLGEGEVGHGEGGRVVLADPDGNEFCLLPAAPD